jgi:hypothetical protein
MTTVSSNPFTIQVNAASGQTGLRFPSNGGAPGGAWVLFYFDDPQNDQLPIAGPSGQGATYIFKAYYYQQTSYYTNFWWGNLDQYLWDAGSPNTYYGFHPHPATSPKDQATTHVFEIGLSDANGGGFDYTETRSGFGTTCSVTKGRWYTHGVRVIRNGNGTKRVIAYADLPSTANGNVLDITTNANAWEDLPPNPALSFGDSRWAFGGPGAERQSGIMRGFKVFNKVLSEADMLSEAASDALVTAEGIANIWWKKINPTPDNLTCEAGTGRTPVWYDTGHKATLWTP